MKRIEWVDIIKGISSIFVVISHVEVTQNNFFLIKTIYLFCMPLYFFVSGYMYKKRENIKEHIKNKSYQLLAPYFSLLILFLPISIFLFPSYTNLFISDSLLRDLGRYFTGRSTVNSITGSIWFLPCLFFTQIIYNIIRIKFKPNTVHFIVFIMLILAYANYIYFKPFWIPFFIHLTLMSIPIYHMGHLYRFYNIKDNIIILSVCTLIAILGVAYIPENVNNIVDTFYGVPFFSLFCSIVLTLVVKNISIGIFKYNLIPSLFINLGKASIVIMAFHLTFLTILEKLLHINSILVVIFSTLIPLGIYFIFNYFTITRALFMGKKEDSRLIKQKIFSYFKLKP